MTGRWFGGCAGSEVCCAPNDEPATVLYAPRTAWFVNRTIRAFAATHACPDPQPVVRCSARARRRREPRKPTFEQWRDNHTEPTHTIMSLHPSAWDREDVLPVGILYGGIGGVSKGIPCSHDGKYIITAAVIESTESACHTHRLNNPSVPVLQMRFASASETTAAVAKFIPRKHWYRMWRPLSPCPYNAAAPKGPAF